MRTLISHGNKCIFVHIPKNAGISIWESLGVCRHKSKHLTLSEIKKETTPQIYNEYSKFAVIRNTYTRLCSLYGYYIVKNKMDRNFGFKIDSFKQFVMCLGNLFPEKHDLHKCVNLTQSQWITVDGEVEIDQVLTFENLNEEYVEYQKDFPKYKGIVPLGHENRVGMSLNPFMEQFDSEMLERVADYYKEDLDRFGHKFHL